jgi:NAD(P)-dependent dehydrogenase (short-subunit alcohol dehydrogenase family)
MQFEKHVVVVTGAAKGIGAACVRAFAREGARVALLDVDKSANELAGSLGERAKFFGCDVAKSADVHQAFAAIRNATEELQKASHKMAEKLYQQSGSSTPGGPGEPGAAPGGSTSDASSGKGAPGDVIDAEVVDEGGNK